MEFGTPIVYGRSHEEDEQVPLYEKILDLAIAADQAGVSRIWFQEHHMIALGQSPSALIACVQIAQHVKARVGSAVVVLPYHHSPIQLAGEIAQADNATGGRLDLGVGRGAYGYEFDKFRIPLNESLPRFIETLEALKTLFVNTDKESSFKGDFVDFEDVYVWPRPIQQPHPPIWIAAQSLPAVEDAARRGYHVLHQSFIWDDAHVQSVVDAFNRGKEQGGNPDLKLGVTRYAYFAENDADTEARIDDLLDNWRVHQQLHDFSHKTNPLGVIKPVVQENEPDREEIKERVMIGTEDHIIAKTEKYQAMGIDVMNLGINFGTDSANIKRSLERLAPVIAKYGPAAR
jgi:alkanesulfonate monooxygenase SsuD/methylene tetrahydromethanopterin reductase-like flavin-dependent oxidoreductase (luciferase family)